MRNMIHTLLSLSNTFSQSKMKNLNAYLSRIGLDSSVNRIPNKETLELIMNQQSRSIAFENFDVVLRKQISIAAHDVETKLVDDLRGGYCFEQNTLLKMALEEIGFDVTPVLSRVRWMKADDTNGPNTTFTHLVLKVKPQDGGHFLADVGFAGTNSIQPIDLDAYQVPQDLVDGKFRVIASKHSGFHVLELLIKDEWKPLYEWREKDHAPQVDQECSNWFCCTHPTARFTTQLFASIIIGDERHHILNDQYVIRQGNGIHKEIRSETIASKERLLELIDTVFGVKLKETEGIDRYLSYKQLN